MLDAMGDAMDTLAEGPDAVPRRKSGRTAKPTPKRVESNLDPSFLGAKAPVAPTQKPEDDDDDLADLDMEEAESDEEPEDQALYCLCLLFGHIDAFRVKPFLAAIAADHKSVT